MGGGGGFSTQSHLDRELKMARLSYFMLINADIHFAVAKNSDIVNVERNCFPIKEIRRINIGIFDN